MKAIQTAQWHAERATQVCAVLSRECLKKDIQIRFVSTMVHEMLLDARQSDAYIGILRQTLNEHGIMVPPMPERPSSKTDKEDKET